MDDNKVYLYGLKEDYTLDIQTGTVNTNFDRWSKRGRFISDKGRRCYVADEPAEVHYLKIWLVERDDELAKRLFIEYHERKIKDLKRAILPHKQAIAALNGEK